LGWIPPDPELACPLLMHKVLRLSGLPAADIRIAKSRPAAFSKPRTNRQEKE